MAERVADECCEPSPGSNGSLVGYQVRLNSARCLYACSTNCFLMVLIILEASSYIALTAFCCYFLSIL